MGMTVARTKAAASSDLATQGWLGTCAVAVICTASPDIANDPQHRPQSTFALVIAGLTVVHVVGCILLHQQGKTCGLLLERVFAVGRFVLWTILASWCTFSGPFVETDTVTIAVGSNLVTVGNRR